MSRADLVADVRKHVPGGKLLYAHVPLINAVADASGLPSAANDWSKPI